MYMRQSQSSFVVEFRGSEYRGSSYLDGVPVLAGEGVDGLLLETLLALRQSLVPVMKTTISALPPSFFRHRRIGRRKVVKSMLRLEQLTHLPTAIFAKSDSQRRIIVVGRIDGGDEVASMELRGGGGLD